MRMLKDDKIDMFSQNSNKRGVILSSSSLVKTKNLTLSTTFIYLSQNENNISIEGVDSVQKQLHINEFQLPPLVKIQILYSLFHT